MPCDVDGNDCPPGAPPPPLDEHAFDDYSPYESQAEFNFTDFLFSKEQMSSTNIDILLNNLAALYPNDSPLFALHQEIVLRVRYWQSIVLPQLN